MLYLIFAIIIGSSTIIGFYNYITATRLKPSTPTTFPMVSILIPARNEEKNIQRCLDSIVAQDYPHFEIIVYDDVSEDGTAALVTSYGTKVKLLSGQHLPSGWTGKNWGCHHLAQHAKGELFLFLDADVTIKPETVRCAVALMQQKKVALLSGFPIQEMHRFGEWLIIPLIDWLLLSFVPLDLIYRTRTDRLSMGIGQFLLIDKKVYEKIGGHERIAGKKSDDTCLAKNVKTAGEKIVPVRSIGLVHCRMYSGFRESLQGLSASFYAGTNLKPIPYILSLIGFAALFFLPIGLYITNTSFLYLLIPLLLQRILTSHLSRQNILFNLLLLPVHGIMVLVVGINSLYISLTHTILWKGRRLGIDEGER